MFVHFVPQVGKTFCFCEAKRPQHRSTEGAIVRVVVLHVVRTVVRAVVRAIVRREVVVLEDPGGRHTPANTQLYNGHATYSRALSTLEPGLNIKLYLIS